jgi:hypothetical protein
MDLIGKTQDAVTMPVSSTSRQQGARLFNREPSDDPSIERSFGPEGAMAAWLACDDCLPAFWDIVLSM